MGSLSEDGMWWWWGEECVGSDPVSASMISAASEAIAQGDCSVLRVTAHSCILERVGEDVELLEGRLLTLNCLQ